MSAGKLRKLQSSKAVISVSDPGFAELQETARQATEAAKVVDAGIHWDGLPTLWDMFGVSPTSRSSDVMRFEDVHVLRNSGVCISVATRYLKDISRFGLKGRQNDFMKAMVEKVEADLPLSPRMVKGVLNTIGGGIKWNRGRFWKSRNRRAQDAWNPCIICGDDLENESYINRGAGPTCYKRIMGG